MALFAKLSTYDERSARPVQLTDAGKVALADRAPYDMEPYEGGMIEPGWTAIPTPKEVDRDRHP